MEHELTTVATFANSAEADLAKERLELEGIKAFVMGATTANVVPHVSSGQMLAVQVATDRAAEAREILGVGAPK
jgi:hypothetical protein